MVGSLPEVLPLLLRVDGSAGLFGSLFGSWLCFPALPLPPGKYSSKVSFRLLCPGMVVRYALFRRSRFNRAKKSMNYRIRVKGHLDASWQEWFEGLEMVQDEEGTYVHADGLNVQDDPVESGLEIRTLG